jgi:hypothetical protein
MTAYLLWDENHRVDVHTIESLNALLDELEVMAEQDMPISVELHLPNGTSMYIVIGGDVSPVMFGDPTQRPPIIGAVALYTGPDADLEFNHRGHYSLVEKKYTLPVATARAALVHFFQTGTRPETIAWEY